MKRSFDKKAKEKSFREGDLVLKWDADRVKAEIHSKLDALWSDPYIIGSFKKSNTFQLSRPNGKLLPIIANGIYLKPYF